MSKTTAVKNAMLAPYVTAAVYASLHTADPGATGASEATGGSPAYARKLISWGTPGTPTAGQVSGGTVTFDVPAGTYTHIGYWSAITAGTFADGYALNASVVAGAQTTVPVAITESQA